MSYLAVGEGEFADRLAALIEEALAQAERAYVFAPNSYTYAAFAAIRAAYAETHGQCVNSERA